MSTIEKLKSLLSQMDNVVFAYLFGSEATGQQHKNSDLDIAVYLTAASLTLDERLAIHHELVKALHREVDLIVLNDVKSLLLVESILKEGILIKDSGDDTRELFELRRHHDILDFKAFKRSIDAA